MNIRILIDKYFEGETSASEEQLLRNYFQSEKIAEDLEVYRPMFTFFSEEREFIQDSGMKLELRNKNESENKIRRMIVTISSIAASLILLTGIGFSFLSGQTDTNGECYVYIDGKRYTDKEMVQLQARASLFDVQSSQEEIADLLFNENE